jgi:hypothetical protein
LLALNENFEGLFNKRINKTRTDTAFFQTERAQALSEKVRIFQMYQSKTFIIIKVSRNGIISFRINSVKA